MMNAEIGHKFEPAVGALLRASRLRCGEEIRDVAASLRIRQAYLEAIEVGRYEDLPGLTYAVGFVRTYAEHLGLDSEEVVRRFKAESENLERRTELVFPSPIAERGTPGAAIIFIGVLVAALAYGAWYIGTSEDSVFEELVTPLPDRLAALLPGDTGQPAQPDQGPSTAEAAPQPDSIVPQTVPAETGSLGSPPPQQIDATDEVQPEAVAAAPAAPVSETGTAPATAGPQMPSSGTDQAAVPAPAEQNAPVIEATQEPVPQTEPEAVARVETATPAFEGAAVPEAPAAVEPPQVTEVPAEPEVSEPVAAASDIPRPSEPVQEPAVAETPAPLPEAPASAPAAPAAAESEPQIPAEALAGPAPAEEPQVAEVPAAARVMNGDVDEQTARVPSAPANVPAAPAVDSGDTAAGDVAAEQVAAVPEAPAAEAVTNAPAADTGGARIEVRALSDSWIQIRDGVARRLLVTRLLRAGDTYVVPDQPGLTLLTGNAGALEILVDGQAVKPIGEEGAVRRNVALDAERLLSGTAVVD